MEARVAVLFKPFCVKVSSTTFSYPSRILFVYLSLVLHWDFTFSFRSMAFSISSEYQIRTLVFSANSLLRPRQAMSAINIPLSVMLSPVLACRLVCHPRFFKFIGKSTLSFAPFLRFLTFESVAPKPWRTPTVLLLIRMDPGVYPSESSLASNVLPLVPASAESPAASLARMGARVLPSTPVLC